MRIQVGTASGKDVPVVVQNFTDLDYGPSRIICKAFSE